MATCPNCKKEVLEGLPFCPYCGSKSKASYESKKTYDYENEDPYQIFQIYHEAEPEIIEAVYKSLAKKYHPDKGLNQTDERMKKINWAYSILRDKEKRATWDSEHTRRKPAETTSSKTKSDPVPEKPTPKISGSRLLVLIFLGVSLITIIILFVSLSNYHREYERLFSYYATAKAILESNNYPLISTVTTQSSTKAAQDATVISQQSLFEFSKKSIQYGDGSLKHWAFEEYVEPYCINEYQDFIVEVVFINPYKADYGRGWDYGILFSHQGADDQYRLVFSSDKYWALYKGVSEPLEYGLTKYFDTSANGQNKIGVIVKKNLVTIFVNDSYLNSVSLPANVKKGEICLATGLYEGDEFQGAYTHYRDFIVEPITSNE